MGRTTTGQPTLTSVLSPALIGMTPGPRPRAWFQQRVQQDLAEGSFGFPEGRTRIAVPASGVTPAMAGSEKANRRSRYDAPGFETLAQSYCN